MMKKGTLQFNLYSISQFRNEIFGLTIIWIMLLHGVILNNVQVPAYCQWMYVILKHGNVGVDIFLFLSGIGLFFSFSSNSNLQNYLKKRFVRILLPYGLIGGTYFVFWDIIINGSVWAFVKDFTLMSFLFKGNKLIWYVFVILFCYLIFPYLYQLFYDSHGKYKKNAIRNIVLAVCVVVVFAFVLKHEYTDVYNNIEIAVTRLPVFILGAACGGVVKNKKTISFGWVILAFVIVITSYPIFVNTIFKGIYQRYYYCVLAIALIVVFAFLFSVIKSKVVHKILLWFGAISFELYCAHILLRNLYMKTSWSDDKVFLKYLLVLLLAVIIAKYVSMLEDGILKKYQSIGSVPTTQTEKPKRIVWIDQYKAIVFYLVILGHMPLVIQAYDIFAGKQNAIIILIYSFHMPAFFFASGLTFKRDRILQNGLRSYGRTICQRILLPYLWLNLILFPLWVFTFKVLSKTGTPLMRIFKGIFYANPDVIGMPQGALWFLTTLFLALLVYAILVKGSQGSFKKMLPGIVFLAAVGYITREMDVIWHLNGVPVAVIFIFIGNVFFEWYNTGKIKKLMKLSVLSVIPVIAAAVIWFELALCNGKISLIANVYGSNKALSDKLSYLIFFVVSCLAIYVLVYIIEKIPGIKWLSYFGQNTILYIGIHVPIFRIIQILLPEWTTKPGILFIISLGLFVLMIPCSLFVNKVFPYINGVKYAETSVTKIGKVIITIIVLVMPLYLAVKKVFPEMLTSTSGCVVYVAAVIIIGIVASIFIQRYLPCLYGKQIDNK